METESQTINKSQRVQFTDDTNKFGHDSIICVLNANEFLINVHLGFLQIRHRYMISFTFECPDCIEGSLVVRNQDSSCLNLHVTDLRSLGNGNNPLGNACTSKSMESSNKGSIQYRISIELFAHKEKLLKEQISLHSSENVSQTLTLVLHARVLGKFKGTPFLKNGIKCIGVEKDEDEDNSDWQGFNN